MAENGYQRREAGAGQALIAGAPPRILVIDDSPEGSALLEAQLEQAGCIVALASSGREGLEAVEAARPDLILLDVLMPGLSGYDVLSRLRSNPGTAGLPVIVLTALRERTDKLKALQLGASDFLTKPVNHAELLARVRTLVTLKRTNDLLAESEARFRGLVERLPVVTYVAAVRRDGIAEIEYISPQIEASLGFTVDEWRADGSLWSRQMHPDDLEQSRKLLVGMGAAGQLIAQDVRFRAKDGREVWFRNEATAVADLDAGYVRLNGFLNDITESKRKEEENRRLSEAVEHERQTLAQVMAGMTEGLLVMDAARQVRYCNARAGELLEIDVQEAVGRGIETLLLGLGGRLAGADETLAALAEAGRVVHQRPSFDVVLLGSERRDLIAKLFPVDLGGEEGAGLLLHDVSQERALMRSKDELLSVVSHELRAPMASLVGFAELLLEREYEPAQRREFLTIMYQEGQRLTALINDFLDLQRTESGRPLSHRQPMALGPVLRRAVLAAGDDPERPIVLDLDEAEPLPEVEADADRIQQVLVNLLSNARKYSPDGGEIRLSVGCEDNEVRVQIQDQGLGLPLEAQERLFEKFYRVDAADRTSIGGSGLGLAVCRQIIHEHEGRIGARSDGPGKGSVFWFTLPLARPNPVMDG